MRQIERRKENGKESERKREFVKECVCVSAFEGMRGNHKNKYEKIFSPDYIVSKGLFYDVIKKS